MGPDETFLSSSWYFSLDFINNSSCFQNFDQMEKSWLEVFSQGDLQKMDVQR